MNIFDGKDGRSDGKKDGYSLEILSQGELINIFVSGDFGTGKVRIQKFYIEGGEFRSTAATWTEPDCFQGLIVKPGDRFRLLIEGANAATSIEAEVY